MDTRLARTAGALLVAVALALPGTAAAEEGDPVRLDALFDNLQAAEGLAEAKAIEEKIWNVWVYAGDDETDKVMEYGIRAMTERNLEEALGVFDYVVRTAPDLAEGWNKRATVLFLMGQYGASLRDVKKTLALEPRHFGALSGLGLIFLATGENQRAVEAFEDALDVNPHMPAVRDHLKEAKRRLEDSAI